MSVSTAIDILREKADNANELYRLRDRVEELEGLLGIVSKDAVDLFVWMDLSPTERQVLNILFAWKLVRPGNIFALLYGNRLECDQPDIQLINVWVSKLRRRLRPLGITIDHQPLGGWYLTPENKEKLRLLAEELWRARA